MQIIGKKGLDIFFRLENFELKKRLRNMFVVLQTFGCRSFYLDEPSHTSTTTVPPQVFRAAKKLHNSMLRESQAQNLTKLFTNEFIDLVKGKAMTSIALCLIYINNDIINNNS